MKITHSQIKSFTCNSWKNERWSKKTSTSFLKWCIERRKRIRCKIKLSQVVFAFRSNECERKNTYNSKKINILFYENFYFHKSYSEQFNLAASLLCGRQMAYSVWELIFFFRVKVYLLYTWTLSNTQHVNVWMVCLAQLF